jgi:putative phosphoribosyl transferase
MQSNERLEQEITIPSGRVLLSGTLSRPAMAQAAILFISGSSSSRYSHSNRQLADLFSRAGYATLLFELLTEEEEAIDAKTGKLRFNIRLLSDRVLAASARLITYDDTRLLRLAYFASSIGTAAALQASIELPRAVQALVSQGGRPDFAAKVLAQVTVPTLFIVGEQDKSVLDVNTQALSQLNCSKQLEVVPGATHRFEEPGALDMVASLTLDWLDRFIEWPGRKQSSAS